MLRQQQDVNIIKKGFVYKRGSNCLSRWKNKYFVLIEGPQTCLLNVYDSCTDQQPKYIINSSQIVKVDQEPFKDGGLTSVISRLSLNQMHPFVIVTRGRRRFHFATSSSKECTDWINKLQEAQVSIQNGAAFDYDDEGDFSDVESVYSHYTTRSRAQSATCRRSSSSSVKSYVVTQETDNIVDGMLAGIRPQNIKTLEGQVLLTANEVSNLLLSTAQNQYQPNQQPNSLQPSENFDQKYQQTSDKAKLIGLFQDACLYYGKRILDKYHIKKSDDGAPVTFKHGDLLFNLAAPYEPGNDQYLRLQKNVGNELVAINFINSLQSNVNMALICVIDYLGFRMVCYPAMPLSSKTIIRDVQFREDLLKAANIYNANAEQHQVRGQTYILNCCNMLPSVGDQKHLKFRPEFVVSYEKALPCTVENDEDVELVEHAHQYLIDVVIPNFVHVLDNMQVMPVDSRGFTLELHKNGINVRYMGLIAQSSKLPYIRRTVNSEIVARTFKQMHNKALREAILKFRNVGAVSIADEIAEISVGLVKQLMMGKLQQEISALALYKFELNPEFMYTVQLFNAVCYHCGLRFIPKKFDNWQELSVQDFIEFQPVYNSVDVAVNFDTLSPLAKSMRLLDAYFTKLPLSYRLNPSDEAAAKFLSVAKEHLAQSQFNEAKLYASIGLKLAQYTGVIRCLVVLTLLDINVLQVAATQDSLTSQRKQLVKDIQEEYGLLKDSISFNLTDQHPLHMIVLDKIVHWFGLLQFKGLSFEYLQKSILIADRILGKSHCVSAAYSTKAGYMLLSMQRPADAVSSFQQSLAYYENQTQSKLNFEAIAENNYSIAECHYDLGDIELARKHSHIAQSVRERLYGQQHPKTVDSYQQLAKLIASQYTEYSGVVIENMRKDLNLSITLYEQVFKFVRSLPNKKNDMLLDLLRTVVGLKLRLIPSQHQQLLKHLREHPILLGNQEIKDVIIKMVHLSPSVLLDSVYRQLDSFENVELKSAKNDLAAVLQLVEQQDLTFNG